MKVLLDVGHVNVGGEDPSDSVRKAREYLAHVHIHDNDGTKDQHLVPGDGKIDFAPIVKALREVGYDGYVSAELEQGEGDESALRTRDFFRGAFGI
jgi:sugar phosphate isomerase/epimerase